MMHSTEKSLLKKALEKEIPFSTPNTIDHAIIDGGLLIQTGDLPAFYHNVARYVLSIVCKNLMMWVLIVTSVHQLNI